MTSDQRGKKKKKKKKKPLSCGTAQNISHLRLRYPLGTWNTRVSRRFGRIRELPLLLASRLQGQDPPSLGWTYYDSLGPASDGPADARAMLLLGETTLKMDANYLSKPISPIDVCILSFIRSTTFFHARKFVAKETKDNTIHCVPRRGLVD